MSGLGLVLSGGFLRGAFQVGVIEALHAQGLRFDVVVGVSSGAWNAACVATGQIGEMRRFWLAVARAPKLRLGNLWRHGTPSNFPEIVRRIPMRSLRFERLAGSGIRLRIGASSLRERRLHFFERWEHREAFLASLMAANYLPGVYGRPVRIDGRYYADGGLVDNVPYEAALEAGCRRALVVVADPQGRIRKRLLARRPHALAAAERERVVVLHPAAPLPIDRLSASTDAVLRCIDAGHRAVARGLASGALPSDRAAPEP
ncbi:MAG: patatin-like phospholipase family protein [Deltaproteobacteria bacterium]|nr:patatin-like phospholipase family protein [Deltaproteobacteria bacterium]